MSFGINGPENIPAIQKAQNMMNNGGGGNLGYFQQEKKQEKKKKDEQDVFEFSSKKGNNEEEEFTLDSIGLKIKNFWNLIHVPKKENETENNPDVNEADNKQ